MLNIVFKRYFLNNYAIVILMKNIKVVAAVIINNKKVFATQRGYGEYKDRWEFPGGKIEIGETPEDALKREKNTESHFNGFYNRLFILLVYFN